MAEKHRFEAAVIHRRVGHTDLPIVHRTAGRHFWDTDYSWTLAFNGTLAVPGTVAIPATLPNLGTLATCGHRQFLAH